MKCRILIISILLTSGSIFSQFEGIGEDFLVLADSMDNYHLIPMKDKKIRIDGIFEMEEWENALHLFLNYEVDPGENIEPPVATEIYLAYDEKNLYAVFVAKDPKPADIRARICDRDNAWNDDWVGLILDTYNDERRTYDFFSNPLGVQMDQIESSYSGTLQSWDAVWNSAGTITDTGYTVEMCIPFRALNFPRSEGARIFGIDIVRSYPRSVRHHVGLFPRDPNINSYMNQADKLIGFVGVNPGRNIEIDPTFVAILSQERENGSFENTAERYDPGLTMFWKFASNMKLSATINPDFSQIEADAAELNVNEQYSIYYPEKRPFFLEGSELFSFSIPVFKFRTFADPEWGLKITGKEGVNSIGFVIVEDSITNFTIPNSFYSRTASLEKNNLGAVLRYFRDFGISANAGIILTDREGENYFNRTGGVSGSFNLRRNDRINFAGAYSSTQYPEEIYSRYGQPDTVFEGWSLLGGYYHNTRNLNWYWNFYLMDPFFRGDLGHVYQDNYKNMSTGLDYSWIGSPRNWYRELNLSYSYTYEENFGDTLIYKEHRIGACYSGSHMIYAEINLFEGQKGFLGEEFDNDRGTFYFQIRPSSMIFLSLYSSYGDDIDYNGIRPGVCLHVEPYIELNVGRNFYVEISHEYEEMEIEEGKLYTANVLNLSAKHHFSHKCFVRGILQYVGYVFDPDLYPFPISRESKSIFTQLLFSYKVNPQTVLYLGYSDNYDGDEVNPIAQRDRTLFAKVGYSFVI
ncbi:carbohydrate binding family 9 domain-containing protein [candidate division WOR-3 bacterium]|nr:carbohydrate binding family 9 domain-containing protein [candidate division WOR-3 bacterium]